MQSSSPASVQTQVHELLSVVEYDACPVLKSEKLIKSLVLVRDPLT